MITIDQLLESVELDFEPRFVTKDGNGDVYIFEDVPETYEQSKQWVTTVPASGLAGYEGLKLSEFADKNWQDCIYEVPRKTTGKIKKLGKLNLSGTNMTMNQSVVDRVVNVLNQVIDAVNELKGSNNELRKQKG